MPSDKDSLKFKELKHVNIEKVEQLFRTCSLKNPGKRDAFMAGQLQNPAAQGDIISGPWANAIAAQLAGLV